MERKSATALITWINEECGGRKHPPFVGLRSNIRWQRHVRDWLNGSWDAEITNMRVVGDVSEVVLTFFPNAEITKDRLKPGELIELLDGASVIGVGKIIYRRDQYAADSETRKELQTNFRKGVFEVLELIASKEAQLTYQANVPIAHVSAELFCQWSDFYRSVGQEGWFKEAFSIAELETLEEFDVTFEAVSKTINTKATTLSNINEFMQTSEWKQLSKAAQTALDKLYET